MFNGVQCDDSDDQINISCNYLDMFKVWLSAIILEPSIVGHL